MLGGGSDQDQMNSRSNGILGVDSDKVLERNELSQWVEHVTKQLIEDLSENENESINFQAEDGAGMASVLLDELRPKNVTRKDSGESRGFVQHHSHQCCTDNQIEEDKNNLSYESGKGLMINARSGDESRLKLLGLLLECAAAISLDNLGEAHRMLLELTQMASPYASSCAERVVAYFAMAMSSRVINSWLRVSSPLINHKSLHDAFQAYNHISPFVKSAHFTSN